MSIGENKICQLLNRAGVHHEREKTFYDLKGGAYRYDFFIPAKNGAGASVVIEYNGEQHYYQIPHFHKTNLQFRQAQGRDMRKISYCLANDIPIYIIPYWELDKLTTVEDLFNPKYLAKDRYKNYTDWEEFTK